MKSRRREKKRQAQGVEPNKQHDRKGTEITGHFH